MSGKDLKIYPVIPDEEIRVINREFPEPLQKPPFVHLYLGSRGTSKTTTLVNLLMRECFYGDRQKKKKKGEKKEDDTVFSQIIIFSSTLGSDQTGRFLVEKIGEGNCFDYYDDSIIDTIVENQKSLEKKDRRHILIIADDFMTMIKSRLKCQLFKLCSNHRHYLVSLAFLCQTPLQVPPVVFNCLTGAFIFRNPSFAEQEKICERLSFMGGKNNMLRLMEYGTREPYTFLYIDALQNTAWKWGGQFAPKHIWSRYTADGHYSPEFNEGTIPNDDSDSESESDDE